MLQRAFSLSNKWLSQKLHVFYIFLFFLFCRAYIRIISFLIWHLIKHLEFNSEFFLNLDRRKVMIIIHPALGQPSQIDTNINQPTEYAHWMPENLFRSDSMRKWCDSIAAMRTISMEWMNGDSAATCFAYSMSSDSSLCFIHRSLREPELSITLSIPSLSHLIIYTLSLSAGIESLLPDDDDDDEDGNIGRIGEADKFIQRRLLFFCLRANYRPLFSSHRLTNEYVTRHEISYRSKWVSRKARNPNIFHLFFEPMLLLANVNLFFVFFCFFFFCNDTLPMPCAVVVCERTCLFSFVSHSSILINRS